MNINPYHLCRVRNDEPGDPLRGITYIAEAVSRPTPNNMLIVRAAPGDPQTVRAVPLSAVQSVILEPRTHYVHYAVVSGPGNFPLDMLRYDCAVPVNFKLDVSDTGTATIGDTWRLEVEFGVWKRDLQAPHPLVISHCSAHVSPQWAKAAWCSANWGIMGLHTVEIRNGLRA